MTERDQANTPPSAPDGDGVRVIRKTRAGHRPALGWVLATAVLVTAGVVVLRMDTPTVPDRIAENAAPTAMDARIAPEPRAAELLQAVSRRRAQAAHAALPELPSGDPDDIASYFAPGDPEPTGAELIEALHDLGIRTGIGAFNPPGTSPVLEGIPVPDDYVLPEGYARHHQWTDEGEPIGPILTYAPDFVLYDQDGRPIPLPDNRVVPPHLRPPGL